MSSYIRSALLFVELLCSCVPYVQLPHPLKHRDKNFNIFVKYVQKTDFCHFLEKQIGTVKKQPVHRRNRPEFGSILYIDELTGIWKHIIYRRIDRNLEAYYI